MPTKAWRESPGVVLGVLTGVNAFNYLDPYVGTAVLPLILAGLAISDAQGGLLQSVFVISYALVCPIAGWLGDRQNRLRLAATGVLVWSAATVASGLAPTFLLLLAARAIIGVGEASYSVVTPSLLSDYYTADRRAWALGVFYAAIPAGTALGYVVGGLLGEAFGWRAAFLVAGAPGAVLALALLVFREPPRGRLDVSSATEVTPLGIGASLRALAARRSYLVNTTTQVIYTFAMGGLATWMPTYFVRERDIPLGTAASTFGALQVVAGFAGTLLGGQLSGRLAKRRRGVDFTVSGWSHRVSAGGRGSGASARAPFAGGGSAAVGYCAGRLSGQRALRSAAGDGSLWRGSGRLHHRRPSSAALFQTLRAASRHRRFVRDSSRSCRTWTRVSCPYTLALRLTADRSWRRE
jgi:MFS family permease